MFTVKMLKSIESLKKAMITFILPIIPRDTTTLFDVYPSSPLFSFHIYIFSNILFNFFSSMYYTFKCADLSFS